MKIYRDIPQGSAEWFRLRMGIPTASCFDQVMTPKTRKLSASWKKYACKLVAERLTNIPAESMFESEIMRAAKEQEPQAAAQYEFVNDVELATISFVTNDSGTIGCSPDRGVFDGDRLVRLVEIKVPKLETHLYYQHFLKDDEPYRTQTQGQLMLCTDAKSNELYSFYQGGPPVSFPTVRDEPYIDDLATALDEFVGRVDDLHEATLRLGVWLPPETRVATPLDRERGEQMDGPDDIARAIEEMGRRAENG